MYKIEKAVREFNGKKNEINFICGVGNLTEDIKTREIETRNGKAVVAGGFGQSIAFNYFKDGEEKVKFYTLEAWDKTAENLAKWGKKGVQVFIAGRVEERSYKNKEGEIVKNEVLVVELFQITQNGFEKINNRDTNNHHTGEKDREKNNDDDNSFEDDLADEWTDIPF